VSSVLMLQFLRCPGKCLVPDGVPESVPYLIGGRLNDPKPMV